MLSINDAELANLYHTACTAVGNVRYSRMVWAVNEYVKLHPESKKVKVYLRLEYLLSS